MTKRRIATHEECLKSFTYALKREVKDNLAAWKVLNREQAIGRRMAFSNIVFLLKKEAEKHGIPLADLGLVDYEVPNFEE
ncbi:hypothetical protein SAMN05518865_1231 [Duganella sp. CF458]|uniref:hypothetical protein n=1 Tax=Duganella sp. CF458 TaxID=1884368 RepID=UPI0008EDF214|nr:hypothetical protein [Duganella sp. CF458]SFG91768.1 hypothetical protein SAMN05518865_1231 [Duganella sp. CF458]